MCDFNPETASSATALCNSLPCLFLPTACLPSAQPAPLRELLPADDVGQAVGLRNGFTSLRNVGRRKLSWVLPGEVVMCLLGRVAAVTVASVIVTQGQRLPSQN